MSPSMCIFIFGIIGHITHSVCIIETPNGEGSSPQKPPVVSLDASKEPEKSIASSPSTNKIVSDAHPSTATDTKVDTVSPSDETHPALPSNDSKATTPQQRTLSSDLSLWFGGVKERVQKGLHENGLVDPLKELNEAHSKFTKDMKDFMNNALISRGIIGGQIDSKIPPPSPSKSFMNVMHALKRVGEKTQNALWPNTSNTLGALQEAGKNTGKAMLNDLGKNLEGAKHILIGSDGVKEASSGKDNDKQRSSHEEEQRVESAVSHSRVEHNGAVSYSSAEQSDGKTDKEHVRSSDGKGPNELPLTPVQKIVNLFADAVNYIFG